MDVVPTEIPHREFYNILINSVAPRPIAWVSTVDAAGRANLAPFSFFNAMCAKPPILVFGVGRHSKKREGEGGAEGEHKDTLRNIRETGEFVVSVVTYELAEAMNLTSGEYEPEIDEFALAKIASVESRVVRPRRVAEAPVSFECKLRQIIDFNPEPQGGSMVVGEIVSAHINEQNLRDGKLDRDSFDLIGRMGGAQYSRTRERFEMVRPK
jgi:flavin reductase (DIM6/NTAB) family NADH-FMN oxidoreductase RutF